jgi:catechol 2,3-dioxygenase-like lactoylglutathione lyase family enzyme
MNISHNPDAITISVRSGDFTVSRDFFRDLLGFEVDIDTWLGEGVIEHPFRRTKMLLIFDPRISIEFVHSSETLAKEIQELGGIPILGFTVDDLDSIKDNIVSRNPQCIVDSGSVPYGRYLTIQDPSGNRIQLFSAA